MLNAQQQAARHINMLLARYRANSLNEEERLQLVREQNDYLRRWYGGGRVQLSAGVLALNGNIIRAAQRRMKAYDEFDEGNDPFLEHDFGSFELSQRRFIWKISYYAPDLEHGSEDPADPDKTTRVLTLLLAEEY